MSACPICGVVERGPKLICWPHWFGTPMAHRRRVWAEPDPARRLAIRCQPFLDILVLDYYDRHPA